MPLVNNINEIELETVNLLVSFLYLKSKMLLNHVDMICHHMNLIVHSILKLLLGVSKPLLQPSTSLSKVVSLTFGLRECLLVINVPVVVLAELSITIFKFKLAVQLELLEAFVIGIVLILNFLVFVSKAFFELLSPSFKFGNFLLENLSVVVVDIQARSNL